MPPSEDHPNARSHLETNLALHPINLRVNKVCNSSIHLFHCSITNPALTQYRQNPSSGHRSWPLPHGNCTSQTSSREPKRTLPRSLTSHRQPRKPVKSTQTSATLRKRSVPYLISAFPNLTAVPHCSQKYKRMSQAAKEAREREFAAYMRTLTPEDIKRENAYRTAQRKAGKSRKANMKDPNAPKKPLSAYFMFLQRIRSDPELVKEVFGDETETTKQSVLAAAKWRSMTDDERKVCISDHPFAPVPPEISLSFAHSPSIAIFSTSRTGQVGLRSRSQTIRERIDRLRIEHRFWD